MLCIDDMPQQVADDIQGYRLDFIAKFRLAGMVFVLASLFLFLPVKYKSFTLCPFRSMYGVSFNFSFFIKYVIFQAKTIEFSIKKVYNDYATQTE